MEIPELILEQALDKSNLSSIHVELNSLLQKLESKSLEVLLNSEKDKEILSIDNEIRKILTTTYYNQKSESNKIDNFAQIIFSVREFLYKGVSNHDVKAIIIFLSVNCYLNIEVGKLFFKSELNEDSTATLSGKIIEILKKIKLTTQILPNAPYWEKEIVNESDKGFLESDISKIYRFVESVERGGRGFHLNFLLEGLIAFLYHINFTCFISSLSYLQRPTDFVFYFQSFKRDCLLKIANESTLSNKWLNFELLRQIIEKGSVEKIDELEVEAVKDILSRIRVNDFDFLKQTIIYFHKNRLFNASLGVFLVSANNAQIEEIISDFSIDQYSFHLKTRDELMSYFAKFATDKQLDLLLKVAFNKWKVYFDNILSAEDFYQNSILLTDFANYIVNYYTRILKDDDLISSMENLMEKIKFIDSEWTTSSFQQLSKFHLYNSELHLLTYVYKYKKLNNHQILKDYENIIQNKIQLSRYVSEETGNYFEIGKQNIDWTKNV